ncbi:MAG: 23S rRNA (guanosine(2251)-2'-O)-methyltransferase RlmB [Armatimonadota bacterium]|nr:23S rRNA (guanosine(2251)-2'-O)-methyltransferase RlmB [Armatimonadota bacterium]
MEEKLQEQLIEGRHPVREALRAGRPLRRILVGKGVHVHGLLQEILEEAKRRGIVVQFVDRRRLDQISRTGAHQSIIAMAAPRPTVPLEEILRSAGDRPPFLVALDGIQDPHNLGSIIRTAEVAGAHGVIIPKRRAAGLTPAVAKASSGAVEYIPVAVVTNLARTLEELKAQGFWIVGADPEATTNYTDAMMTPPIVLVIGGEGKGLSRLVREHCDILVKIPMFGHVGSLNAAVAAGILIYEVVRQRERVLK